MKKQCVVWIYRYLPQLPLLKRITVLWNFNLRAAYSGKGERFGLPPDCYAFCLLSISDLINLMHYD